MVSDYGLEGAEAEFEAKYKFKPKLDDKDQISDEIA
jgi:hypothetical protein